jgi:hypothetical protein
MFARQAESLLKDGVRGHGSVHYRIALRVLCGEFQIARTYALVKFQAFGLKSSLGNLDSFFPAAFTGSGEAEFHRQVEKQGHVRPKSSCGELDKACDLIQRHAASVSLIGEGGGGVAVAEQ